MRKFDGKTALITGGSSGIGLALAENLASQGAHICLVARDPVKLDKSKHQVVAACRDANQRVDTLSADVANYEQLNGALETFMTSVGIPDLVINSAGITYPGLFEEMDLDIHRQNMEVNYFGTLYVTRLIVPGMIRRGSGHIVNISSLVGIHGLYGYSAYSPAKFAVRGLSDTLRYELKHHGIQISVAFPSDTLTPQLEFENQLKPPLLKALVGSNSTPVPAEIVAQKIIDGIKRDKYMILPSSDSALWFLISSLFPGNSLYWLVDRLMDRARRIVAKDLASQQHKGNPDEIRNKQVDDLHPNGGQ